jgi:hypothetical protein
MERADLAELLDQPTDAFTACRDAVLACDEFQIWNADVAVHNLVQTYRRREKHVRDVGHPALGFAEAVTDLEEYGLPFVWLGHVKGQRPPYHFQIFLEPAGTRIVACLAVATAP